MAITRFFPEPPPAHQAVNAWIRHHGRVPAPDPEPPVATPDEDAAPPRVAAGDGDGGVRGTTPPPDPAAAANAWLREAAGRGAG